MKCAIVLLPMLLAGVFGYPYANDYPYNYEYGKNNRNTEGDENRFLANKLSDESTNRKAAAEAAKFFNMENETKNHNLAHSKNGAASNSLKETTGEDYENDKSHKRKHIKSGFHNTYSKDESGSNSSFYEDSDDRGGKLVYDKRHGVRGDSNDSRYQEGLRDGTVRDKYDNRMSGYDSRDSQDRLHYLNEDRGNRFNDDYRKGFETAHGVSSSSGNRYPQRLGGGYRDESFGNGYGLQRPFSDSHQFSRDSHLDRRRPSISSTSSLSALGTDHLHSASGAYSYGGDRDRNRDYLSPTRGGPFDSENYFSRHQITIYEDPRDSIDPREPATRRRQDYDIQRRRDPVLDFRPSSLRYRDFHYDDEENRRYSNY